MADDSRALDIIAAPAMTGTDYDAIFATIAGTERGRWFLGEYAQRHRGADTAEVLAAIAQLEAALTSPRPMPVLEVVRQELIGLAGAVAHLRERITAVPKESDDQPPQRVSARASLSAVADDIERRLHGLADVLIPGEALPDTASPPESQPEPPTSGVASPESVDDSLWNLTIGTETEASESVDAEAELEASITDWAFASPQSDAAEPEPTTPPPESAAQGLFSAGEALFANARAQPASPQANGGLRSAAIPEVDPPWGNGPLRGGAGQQPSTLERIEAREYGRHRPLHEPEETDSLAELIDRPPERLDAKPIRDAIEHLLADAQAGGEEAAAADGWMPWPAAPHEGSAPVAAASSSLLDTDLFNSGTEVDPDDAGTPARRPVADDDQPISEADADRPTVSPMSTAEAAFADADELPDHETGERVAGAQASAAADEAEQAAVLERLEKMRTAIASLMTEIEQKTGRPIQPQSA